MMEEQHRKALIKYSEKQINEHILPAYKRAQDEIISQMSKIFEKVAVQGTWTWTDMQKYNRAEKLLKEIKAITKDLGKEEETALKVILTNTYQEEYARKSLILYYQLKNEGFEELQKRFALADYERNYYQLLQKPPDEFVNIKFNLIGIKEVNEVLFFPWSGADFSERIWKEKNRLAQVLKEELTQSMIQGESMYKASRRIKNKMETSAYNAVRLARTEIMRASNEGHIKAYEEAGIKKVQWLATLDERTCDICAPKDMKIYSIEDRPQMPAHPQCRCTWIPVIEGVSKGKRLDNETGKIIDEGSWEDWKRKKDEDNGTLRLKNQIRSDIRSGKYNLKVNEQKQNRHIGGTKEYIEGRSILTVNAQDVVDKYAGKGDLLVVNGKWHNRERIKCDEIIGTYKGLDGNELKTNKATIHYSKTGTHVVPRKP